MNIYYFKTFALQGTKITVDIYGRGTHKGLII